ncbi:MAG: hypothetical protein ABIK62_03210, partial [candidate division WOR-3 bacterium]
VGTQTSSGSKPELSVPILKPGGQSEDTAYYLWDLTALDLLPGSTVSYYVTATDNDLVSGPKQGQSPTYLLRFPTMADLYLQAAGKTAELESIMTPMSDQQRQLQERVDRIDDALKRSRQLSWDEQQSLKGSLREQDSLLSAVRKLREDVRQVLDKMYEGIVLDSAALVGLRQLDTLLAQVLPSQMLSALDSLRAVLERRPTGLQKALADFRLAQRELGEAIERAVKLLRRLRVEHELNALVRKVDELLTEQQRIIALEAKSQNSDASLAQRQDNVAEGIDSLAAAMNRTSATSDEPVLAADLFGLEQQMRQDELASQARGAAEDYRQHQRRSAREKGERLEQELRALSERLRQLRDDRQRQQSANLVARLLQSASDLLVVSRAQEGLERRMALPGDLRDLVAEEQRLADAVGVIAESLLALSAQDMRIPGQIGASVARVLPDFESISRMLELNSAGASQSLSRTLRSRLNKASAAILMTLQQAQSGGGFGSGMESFLEQLSRAIQEQMALGQDMGGTLPIPAPGELSSQLLQRWQELMARQRAIRQALEDALERLGGQQPGMSSSIQDALEEMRQLEEELSKLTTKRPLVERNEQIVNKLLEAQRSIRQREFGQERESEAGKRVGQDRPMALPESKGERKRWLREAMMRSLKDEFPRAYEPLIRAYFEALLQ